MRLTNETLTATRARWPDSAPTIISGIDESGALYPLEKMDAHRRGLKHLAVSVFVMSGDELLIQQRAPGKYHSGGQWANTCCTHPFWGESAHACALRRVRQELGFFTPLSEHGLFEYEADVSDGLREVERVHVFHGAAMRRSVVVRPNPEEVSAVRWARIGDLVDEAEDAPERFTPWFRIYLANRRAIGL